MKAMRMSRLGQTMSQALNLPAVNPATAWAQGVAAQPPAPQVSLWDRISLDDLPYALVTLRVPLLIGAGVLVGGIVLYRSSSRRKR